MERDFSRLGTPPRETTKFFLITPSFVKRTCREERIGREKESRQQGKKKYKGIFL